MQRPTWTCTPPKSLMGPKRTYTGGFDSRAAVHVQAGDAAEQRGRAVDCHDTQEGRHGARAPDTHTAGDLNRTHSSPPEEKTSCMMADERKVWLEIRTKKTVVHK